MQLSICWLYNNDMCCNIDDWEKKEQSLTVLCICCPLKKLLSTEPVFSWPPTKIKVKVIYHKIKSYQRVFNEILIIHSYSIFSFKK